MLRMKPTSSTVQTGYNLAELFDSSIKLLSIKFMRQTASSLAKQRGLVSKESVATEPSSGALPHSVPLTSFAHKLLIYFAVFLIKFSKVDVSFDPIEPLRRQLEASDTEPDSKGLAAFPLRYCSTIFY